MLRLYPAAWRERYGDELLALIDESRLPFRIVLDVVVAAGVEWFSAAAALIREENISGEPPPKLITARYMFADFLPCTAIVCAAIVQKSANLPGRRSDASAIIGGCPPTRGS